MTIMILIILLQDNEIPKNINIQLTIIVNILKDMV